MSAWRTLAVGVMLLMRCMCWSTVSAVHANESSIVDFFPQPTCFERQLAHALQRRVEVDFVATPLTEVAQWLQNTLELPVALDVRSLRLAGVGPELPITFHARHLPLGTALRQMLAPLNLNWIVRDDLLRITTDDIAAQELVVRAYPVGDLLEIRETIPGRHQGGMGGGMASKVPSEPASSTTERDACVTEPRSFHRVTADYDTLFELIVIIVRPQQWEIGIVKRLPVYRPANCLVIAQTREIHDEILQLLRALRAAKQCADGTP